MKGTGLYIRGLSKSRHGTPKEAAKRAADHGLGHVAIMAVWQQMKGDRLQTLAANMRDNRWVPYAEAFTAAGIDVGLWFYPFSGGEEIMLDKLHQCVEAGPVSFLLADPEVGYKWESRRANTIPVTMRGQGEAVTHTPKTHHGLQKARATKLMQGLHELRDQGRGPDMGLTSYGMAKWHPNFPWKEFAVGVDIMSPQLYSVNPQQVDQGIEMWWDLAEDGEGPAGPLFMTPSIPMFGKNSGAELHHHLSAFVDGVEDIDGFIGWSWRQTSRAEWKTLHRWSEWLAAGQCRLGGKMHYVEVE